MRIVNTNAVEIDFNMLYTDTKHFKPSGLWYSIDNEWVEWCKDNMDHWIKPFNIEIDIGMKYTVQLIKRPVS